MSILIRGLEMPQGEEMLCINVYPDGKVCIDLDLHCKRVATAVPAADVRPVVRGEWLSSNGNGHKVGWDDMNPGCPAESCYCSVCGDWLTASDEYPTRGNFCPNCGADMRGEKDEG